MTGSRGGAILAGLVWSFAPYHFQSLAQINIASLEGLPLTALFVARVRREGGARNLLLLLGAVTWLTATCYNYVIHSAALGALMLVGGSLWDRRTPFLVGTRRLVVAGLAAGVVIVLVAWPLLRSVLASDPGERWVSDGLLQLSSNDLLGFRWIVGPPEFAVVSWPTMLGYSGLLIVALGARSALRQSFWVVVFGGGLVLSLGPVLTVGGEETGVRLVYGALVDLPVVGGMLRRPDRLFLIA